MPTAIILGLIVILIVWDGVLEQRRMARMSHRDRVRRKACD